MSWPKNSILGAQFEQFKESRKAMSDEKVRPFLTRPAVIDWLQWNDFKLRMDEPDYPQLTLSLIAEYKHAHDELMKDARALADTLRIASGASEVAGLRTLEDIIDKTLRDFDKKYPQANEKE